ncbi:TPA: hypothetical protein LVL54_001176 [Klebsiella michiganensis]|nr:hypothetical protein [Klebsiella michiganensis]
MTKSTITRERLEELAAGQSGFNLRTATHEESQELARMALAAMDSEPVAYLVCNGRLYQDRAFMSPLMAEESVKNRNDGAEIKALCVCGKAECAE